MTSFFVIMRQNWENILVGVKMSKPLLIYLIFMNLFTFYAMFSDKRRAKRDDWRIPEHTLFLLAFFGGAAGGLLGMYLLHHKTRHLSFKILMPCFLILNIMAVHWLMTGALL